MPFLYVYAYILCIYLYLLLSIILDMCDSIILKYFHKIISIIYIIIHNRITCHLNN